MFGPGHGVIAAIAADHALRGGVALFSGGQAVLEGLRVIPANPVTVEASPAERELRGSVPLVSEWSQALDRAPAVSHLGTAVPQRPNSAERASLCLVTPHVRTFARNPKRSDYRDPGRASAEPDVIR